VTDPDPRALVRAAVPDLAEDPHDLDDALRTVAAVEAPELVRLLALAPDRRRNGGPAQKVLCAAEITAALATAGLTREERVSLVLTTLTEPRTAALALDAPEAAVRGWVRSARAKLERLGARKAGVNRG
jgi:hypothetical protein